MKTAMLQHIEHLKSMKTILSKQYEGNELLEVVTGTIDGCIVNAEHFIETEKQQIIDAWIDGDARICKTKSIPYAEQYYNERFN